MNKENIIYTLIALIIILSSILLFVELGSDVSDDNLIGGKLKATDCLPEQRDVDACIEIYQPVCGYVQVECIKAPCNPVMETFENSCKACSNSRVISYVQGECQDPNEEVRR